MKSFITILILSLIIYCQTACKKGKTPPDTTNPPPPDTTVTVVTQTTNVYIAGDTTSSSIKSAIYWVNGKTVHLPLPGYSSATCIAVLGNNIYVTAPGSIVADSVTYWKNGQKVVLSDTLGPGIAAQTITVSGNDVYAAGLGLEYSNIYYGAVYWKNNNRAIHLVPYNYITHHQSYCSSIVVSGNDVYVAGQLDYQPVYWKNGVAVPLPLDTSFYARYSIANSIVINNNNTYVAGTLNLSDPYPESSQCRAAYWKNNQLTTLTKDSGSVAHSIFILGSDIYIAGAYFSADELPHACYWKNGELFVLEADYSQANSIAVLDGDVYVVGYVTHLGATYWKNGVPISLGDGEALSLVVTKK